MTDSARVRAAIYARISQDRTGAGLGVARQVAECRQLAEKLGWDVAVVHEDNDISAYSGKRRPGYEALLQGIADGAVTGVLAWHTDRLHRSPAELERYISVCDPRGVATHTVQAGNVDLSTASGRMVARTLGAVARYESEHRGERVRAARRQAALEGRWPGGKRAFGFGPRGVVVPSEAAEIVASTDALLAGTSLRSIVRDLNRRGVPTTLGARSWTGRTWRDVLCRPRNAGLSEYRGEIVGRGQWEPILPEDRWRAVVSLLRDPDRRTSPHAEVRWLGSGLYRCGVCGRPSLRVSRSGNRLPSYRCSSRDFVPDTTGHVVRNARLLDAYVGGLVVERLGREDAAELRRPPVAGVDVDQLHAEAVELRRRLAELSGLYADGAVTAAQLTEGTSKLRRRLELAERAVAAAGHGDPVADLIGAEDLAAVWAGLELGRRRAVLDALMTVTVLPVERRGARFDPGLIQVEWKRHAEPAADGDGS